MPNTTQQSFTAPQVAAIARLFSSTVFNDIARKREPVLLIKLLKQSGFDASLFEKLNLSEIFDTAFKVLLQPNIRPEYVYKSAITQRVLLGRHSLNTAVMLNEFRVGGCKVDSVVFNGTSTAYEIKSDKDNLDRLPSQIQAYKSAFAQVNVICGQRHVESVLKSTPDDVGVLLLNNRCQLSLVRKSLENKKDIKLNIVFDSLQLSEAKRVLEDKGYVVPDVPNTQSYSMLRELFLSLDPIDAHDAMVSILRKNRSQKPLTSFLRHLPNSLHTLALNIPLRKIEREKLMQLMKLEAPSLKGWS